MEESVEAFDMKDLRMMAFYPKMGSTVSSVTHSYIESILILHTTSGIANCVRKSAHAISMLLSVKPLLF